MGRDLLTLVRNALGDRYQVDREIGRGGAARVFSARDPDGQVVALKILHPELQVSTTADRFLREIRLAAQLDHPNIARLLDSGERDWLVYYVMPYVEGPTLRQVLDRTRQLSLADGLRVADDLLAALDHAHARGVVHRDVKPENILISRQGAILVDFGIARAIDASAADRLTRSGIAVGTSQYMSPEQINALQVPDHRGDIYSVGCVLFESLAGRPPFNNRSEAVVLQLHLTEPPPDLHELRPAIPPAIAAAISRALAKRPEERWSSAAAMRDALAQAAAEPSHQESGTGPVIHSRP
jgi:serine/threonine-protein kinase